MVYVHWITKRWGQIPFSDECNIDILLDRGKNYTNLNEINTAHRSSRRLEEYGHVYSEFVQAYAKDKNQNYKTKRILLLTLYFK